MNQVSLHLQRTRGSLRLSQSHWCKSRNSDRGVQIPSRLYEFSQARELLSKDPRAFRCLCPRCAAEHQWAHPKDAPATTTSANQPRGEIFLSEREPTVPWASPPLHLQNRNSERRQRRRKCKQAAATLETRESTADCAQGKDQIRAHLCEPSLITASTPRQDSPWVLVQSPRSMHAARLQALRHKACACARARLLQK